MVAGEKGKRSALKHSRVMIHQPSGGAQGVASVSYTHLDVYKRQLLNFVKLIKLRVYMFSVPFFRRNLMQKATSIFW